MNAMHDLERLLACLDSHPALPAPVNQKEIWQERISEGHPALPDEEFPIETAANLLTFLVRQKENISVEALTPESIVSDYLSGHGTGWENTGISSERGTLYTHLSCQKALSIVADKISNSVSLADWTAKICPVCGSSPILSYLAKEDGRRMLVCGSCLSEWRYKRLGCVYCDETDPEKSQALTTESFPGWSIYACLNCKGFLKTIDLRQIALRPDWRQATLSTLPLDYAAQNWLTSNQIS